MSILAKQLGQVTPPDIYLFAKKVKTLKNRQDEFVIQIGNSDSNASAMYKISVNKDVYAVALIKTFHVDQRSDNKPHRADKSTTSSTNKIAHEANDEVTKTVISELSEYLSKELYTACGLGSKTALQALILLGINFNLKYNKNHLCAPLFVAAKFGHLECVKLLVDSGADVNITNDENATPLMTASFRGHHEIVEYLIKSSASVDSCTVGREMTPVMYAATAGHSACVKALLPKSQNLGKQNSSGNTALMIASEKGYEVVVNFILMHENKSDWINTKNQDGNTALSLAAVNGRCGIVTLLLENHAITDIPNKGNQTAYQRALWNGKRACAQVIKNHVSTPTDSIFRDGIELKIEKYNEV